MKRFFDLLFSGIGLLLLCPLFIILAILIKCDSKGPIFYKQIRVGKKNKDFKIFKFRTMHVNADKGSLITIGGHDSRITRVGYYLRKYKLDELPQLINVFIGDMSIVGPRPEVRKYVNLYTAEQMKVLTVKPGITDAASIAYSNENELLSTVTDPEKYYYEVIMPNKLDLNLQYVSHHSFIGDIKLIFSTLLKICKSTS